MSAPRETGVQPASQNPKSEMGGNFPDCLEIVAVDAAARLAMTDDGFVFPITNFFAADGAEVDDAEDAARFVAGPDAGGRWRAEWLANFGGTRH